MKKTMHTKHVVALSFISMLLFPVSCSTAQKNISSLADTYWRNDSTGDWFIGFAEKSVIFENRVWKIAHQTEQDSSFTLTLNDGRTVYVGKPAKGMRQIAVDGGAAVSCSQITTPSMPDYPTKDTRNGFVDSNYRLGDSVTIVGWLKDMPRKMWRISGEFGLTYHDIFNSRDDKSAYAKLESDGQFTLRFPLLNTTEVFVDWKRLHISSVLEPGKTYFLLVDFKTMQCLFMGDDVRLQNELVTCQHGWISEHISQSDYGKVDAMDFKARVDGAYAARMAELENLVNQHPTLSQRYIDYLSGYYRASQGFTMMQARYSMPNYALPQEYMDFVRDEIWLKATKPYTLYHDFGVFLSDYPEQLGISLMGCQNKIENNKDEYLKDAVQQLEKQGIVTLSSNEKQILDQWCTLFKQFKYDMSKAQTDDERKAIVDKFNSNELVAQVNSLFKRIGKPLDDMVITMPSRMMLAALDSIGCDRNLRDICFARSLYADINHARLPLIPAVQEFAEHEIALPAAKAAVLDLNAKYIAVSQKEMSNESNLKTSDDVAGMSDGEQILKKITEPYKGRLILVDVWGVWCNPCKEALSHSAEEYERLKEFDLVYLYLANRSSDESWKNVIKEYNVEGKNVIHYNLPQDQQSAVEHFLNVNAYPTYRLIDRSGRVLEVNADPRDLEALAKLLEKVK